MPIGRKRFAVPSETGHFFHQENHGAAEKRPQSYPPGVTAVAPTMAPSREFTTNNPLKVDTSQIGKFKFPYDVQNFDFNSPPSEVEIVGNINFIDFIYATNANGTPPLLMIRLDSKNNKQIYFAPGVSLSGFECSRIFVSGSTVNETGQLLTAFRKTSGGLIEAT